MTHQERLPIFRCKNVNIRGILGECTGIESWICMGVTRQTATSCSNVGGRHKRGGKFFQWRYGAILHLKYYLGDIWKFSYIIFIILSNVAKQMVMANSDILLMASSDILFSENASRYRDICCETARIMWSNIEATSKTSIESYCITYCRFVSLGWNYGWCYPKYRWDYPIMTDRNEDLWVIGIIPRFSCINDVYWLEGLRALLLRSLTWDYILYK